MQRRNFIKLTAAGIGTGMLAGCTSEGSDTGAEDNDQTKKPVQKTTHETSSTAESTTSTIQTTTKTTEAAGDIVLIEDQFGETDDFGSGYKEYGVTGKIKSTYAYDVSVEISVKFYNKADEVIGDNITYVDLAQGETGLFELPWLGDQEVAENDLDSYQLEFEVYRA